MKIETMKNVQCPNKIQYPLLVQLQLCHAEIYLVRNNVVIVNL